MQAGFNESETQHTRIDVGFCFLGLLLKSEIEINTAVIEGKSLPRRRWEGLGAG